MREHHLGTAISVLVHLCVILLLVVASFALQNRPVKEVEIDFSLMKDSERGSPAKGRQEIIEKRTRIRRGEAMIERIVEPYRPVRQNPETNSSREQIEPFPVPAIVTASDAQSETAIHGVAATYAGSPGAASSLQSYGSIADGMPGGGHSSGQDDGEGLAEGGRNYNYIRDAIMKNIRYPDEAIRLGIEGKVLLSFVVLENGTTSKIEVISGSGCRLLDESAKEAVAVTRINRKVPYRVIVHLPITYKLQGVKG